MVNRQNSDGLNVSSNAWTAPADATNTLNLPSFGSGYAGNGASAGHSASCSSSMSLSVKITATWQGTDPVPPSVEVIETAQATAVANGTNGYDNPSYSVNDGLESAPAGSKVAVTPTGVVPPAHLTTQSSSSWSITRTFAVSASEAVNVPVNA